MTNLRSHEISPEHLLLDPNNYRFQDLEGFVYAAEDRFHEETVQDRALQRIRSESNLIDLKKSILRNGFISVERLVVRPYEYIEDEMWLVIEGNRRLAAVRWILDDYEAGAEVNQEVIDSIRELPVVIAEEETPDEIFRASLMGIRHVSGIDDWGGYQRAKLIAVMRDDLHLDPGDIAERLGLSTHEVNRRYRAFKALEQMQDDEEYGGYAKPSMYPLFHEAVSLPVAKEWLEWDEEQNEFTNDEERRIFYGLLSPSYGDDNGGREPKIKTDLQVRELRNILPKSEARRLLFNPDRSFEDAQALAKREEFSRLWASDVSVAIGALENMGVQELKNLSQEDLELLQKLEGLVKERLGDYQSLSRSK